MLIWDGSINDANGVNYGTTNLSDATIDNYQMNYGHGYCNPPLQSW